MTAERRSAGWQIKVATRKSAPGRCRGRLCAVNAVAESFFATIKKKLIHRRARPTKAELRTEVFDCIEV